MKKELKLFICLSLLISCETVQQVSKGEECFNLESGGCYCINTILEEGDEGYSYSPSHGCVGYTSISPDRREQLQDEWNELAVKYLKCKKNPKNCK